MERKRKRFRWLGGKAYYESGQSLPTKTKAKSRAKKLRKAGWNVRVLKIGKGYNTFFSGHQKKK